MNWVQEMKDALSDPGAGSDSPMGPKVIHFQGKMVRVPDDYSRVTRVTIEMLNVYQEVVAEIHAYLFSKHGNPKKPSFIEGPVSINKHMVAPALGNMLSFTENPSAFPYFFREGNKKNVLWTPEAYFKIAEPVKVNEVPIDALPPTPAEATGFLRFPPGAKEELSNLDFGPKPVYKGGHPAWSNEEAAQVREGENKRQERLPDESMPQSHEMKFGEERKKFLKVNRKKGYGPLSLQEDAKEVQASYGKYGPKIIDKKNAVKKWCHQKVFARFKSENDGVRDEAVKQLTERVLYELDIEEGMEPPVEDHHM
mgnify:CR=1 FL=1